jgi:GcrA cell cycle regulator
MTRAAVCGVALAAQVRSTWTPERVEQLMDLFDEGLPTAEIGRRMGVSKNTIIGKLCRLGQCRKSACTTTPNPFPGSGACVWPHGDPGDAGFHFCGAKALPGKPYCAECAAHAYERPKEQEPDLLEAA